jgi:hypothetical protein
MSVLLPGDRIRSPASGVETVVLQVGKNGWLETALGAGGWSDPRCWEAIVARERVYRVLLYGDLQVNSVREDYMAYLEEALGGLVASIREHRPDLVVNLGDTFDTFGAIDVGSLLFAYRWMTHIGEVAARSAAKSIPRHPVHFILRGNHDTARSDGLSPLQVFSGSHTQVFDEADSSWLPIKVNGEGRVIHCFPYGSEAAVPEILARYPGETLLSVGHVEWRGQTMTPALVSRQGLDPAELAALCDRPFLNGHYHMPQERPPLYIVGSPLFCDFRDGESEIPRGWCVLDLYDDGAYEVKRLENPRTYHLRTIRVDTEQELAQALSAIEIPAETKVRVFGPAAVVEAAVTARERFLWLGAYPTETGPIGLEHQVTLDAQTSPQEVVERAVSLADEAFDRALLTEQGLDLFAVAATAKPDIVGAEVACTSNA